MSLLRVEDLFLRYPGQARPDVDGLSFAVERGEIFALLGPSGSGKTSTLRTIARLANPRLGSGEIWLDGQPLHRMAAWQAARCGVGLVPEDRRIIGGLTVEENLLLAQIEEPRGWSLERIYEHFPRLAVEVRRAASEISRRLGHREATEASRRGGVARRKAGRR